MLIFGRGGCYDKIRKADEDFNDDIDINHDKLAERVKQGG